VNKRRSDFTLDPQKLFSEVMLAPLDWPGKTIRLESNSVRDYRHRSLSPGVSAAELYHENSKMFPAMMQTLAATEQNPYQFRREFIHRRSATLRNASYAFLSLDLPWRSVLSQVGQTNLAELYAIELCVVSENLVAVHEPLTDVLQVVQHLTPADIERIRRAVRLTASPNIPPHSGPYIFVIGSFARNEILYGQRGYRNTLLEAGRITQTVMNGAAQRGLAIWPVYEFVDRDLDIVLQLDGIEESALVAFELKGAV
jgi:Nitroreductase family